MAQQFRYLARRFLQHPNNQAPLLSLVASSDDIVKWAGVPRKAYEFRNGTLVGFQRQLDDARIREIRDFISSERNVSPTAVVVAFREGTISLHLLDNNEKLKGGNDPGELVWVEFKLDDSPPTLSEAIKKYLALVTPRLPATPEENEADNIPSVDQVEVVDDEEEFIIHDSHLLGFVRSLRAKLDDLCQQGDDPDLYSEEEKKLLETLTELLKPAMLVDGQHRVYGAHILEMDVAFTVCALSNVSWEEQVFQFVVVNQKAQPIAPEFLSAIVSTSLTQTEISNLMERLSAARINVEEHQMMDRVNHDPESPFRGMVKFKIAGEEGKLPYPGMRQIANQFRRLTPDPRFSNVAAHLCAGKTITEKKRNWAGEKWFGYFCAFWGVIKDKYGDTPPGEKPLWNPESQLLKIAVLQIIQDEFLAWSSYSKQEWPSDIEAFKRLVRKWIENVPRAFFAEDWKGVKSIPTPESRERIRESLRTLIENANYQFRRARLFKER